MQRKILDMVPRNKPALPERKLAAEARPVSVPLVKKEKPLPVPEKKLLREPAAEHSQAFFEPRPAKPRKPRSKKLSRILFLVLLAAGGTFSLMTYFANAKMTVIQKKENVLLDTSLTANLETGGDLPYRTITLEKDASITVPASSQENVVSKAVGTVIVYNNYSAAPYRLIKNTRLEASNGLIFKISDTVVVPGKQTEAGKVVPGSATVSVFADSDGPEYNVGFEDFTIPGFKGSPQYAGFYARSKTSIDGGWNGVKKIASQEDIAKADAKLRTELAESLVKTAQSEIPDDYLLFGTAYAIVFEPADPRTSDKGVDVSEHAIFRGALFKKSDIVKIALKKSAQKAGAVTDADGIEALELVPLAPLADSLAAGSPIKFSLKGPAVLKTAISTADLQKALAGKPRSEAGRITALFPGISKAEADIFPFWKASFPKDPQKIGIIVQ